MDLADIADLHIEAHIEEALSRHSRLNPAGIRHVRCSECDVEIPPEPRELVPHVSTCVDCAAAQEVAQGWGRYIGPRW